MFFIIVLGLAAFSLASISGFFSIIGLSLTFPSIYWSVVAMGISLEFGKLVSASFLYRYWNKISKLLKTYLLIAIAILVLITSMGNFGYLSAGFLIDSTPLKQVESQVKLLADEENQLIVRKKQIDQQVAQLKTDDVRGRQRLSATFKAEIDQINKRLPELTIQKQELQAKQIQTEAHVGPMVYVAKTFGLPIDDATKYIIFSLILVFDPLAVVLTICVNIAIRVRTEEIGPKPDDPVKIEPKSDDPLGNISDLKYFQNGMRAGLKPNKIPDSYFKKPFTEEQIAEVKEEVMERPIPTPSETIDFGGPPPENPRGSLVEKLPEMPPEEPFFYSKDGKGITKEPPPNYDPTSMLRDHYFGDNHYGPEDEPPIKVDVLTGGGTGSRVETLSSSHTDQSVVELANELEALQSKPDPTPQELYDMEMIKKYFARAKLIEKVRSGTL